MIEDRTAIVDPVLAEVLATYALSDPVDGDCRSVARAVTTELRRRAATVVVMGRKLATNLVKAYRRRSSAYGPRLEAVAAVQYPHAIRRRSRPLTT